MSLSTVDRKSADRMSTDRKSVGRGSAVAPQEAPGGAAEGTRRADSMAVASFVLGLVGLLVLNVVLGPIAVVLACIALRTGTARRGRAFLGLGLGVADLLVLAALAAVNSTVVWNFG